MITTAHKTTNISDLRSFSFGRSFSVGVDFIFSSKHPVNEIVVEIANVSERQ